MTTANDTKYSDVNWLPFIFMKLPLGCKLHTILMMLELRHTKSRAEVGDKKILRCKVSAENAPPE